jgi:hypothetical protein
MRTKGKVTSREQIRRAGGKQLPETKDKMLCSWLTSLTKYFESAPLMANFQSRKLSVDWNGHENVPIQSLQDKEKFSCPFQSMHGYG